VLYKVLTNHFMIRIVSRFYLTMSLSVFEPVTFYPYCHVWTSCLYVRFLFSGTLGAA